MAGGAESQARTIDKVVDWTGASGRWADGVSARRTEPWGLTTGGDTVWNRVETEGPIVAWRVDRGLSKRDLEWVPACFQHGLFCTWPDKGCELGQ